MNYKSKKDVDLSLAVEKLNKIISLLPSEYSDLIEEAFKYKLIPKEYLLSAILFTVSTSVGLTFYIKAFGYKNFGNCYFTIVGSRGDAKSEAIKIATNPLKEIDDKDYENYQDMLGDISENETPEKRKQILIQNATIEAAHKIHSENPNSVGIYIDEIFALVEKMSNPNSRDGIEWRSFFLEGYTNGPVDISRKTTESFRIKETYPTLIGGLQFQFVPKLFANGNLESGFIDRQFFTPKLTSNNKLSWGEIAPDVDAKYRQAVTNILAYKRQSEAPEEIKKQFKIEVSQEAINKMFDYTQDLINKQSTAKPVIKEYMAKMRISIHKLCILVFMMKHSLKSEFASVLSEEDVNLAIALNEFYFLNFQAIISQNFELKNELPLVEQIVKMAKLNNASQTAVAEITGLNKSTISRKFKKVS